MYFDIRVLTMLKDTCTSYNPGLTPPWTNRIYGPATATATATTIASQIGSSDISAAPEPAKNGKHSR